MSITFDDLHKTITQGEGASVEFKRELSEEVIKGLSTDICSFANSQGGRIIFGVTDDREPAGCILNGNEKNRVSQAASECRPAVNIDIEEVPFGKKTFLVVTIPASIALHSDKDRRFPVRIGNITDYLDASGLVMLLQQRALIGERTVELPTSTSERKREPLPSVNQTLILRALRSKISRVRIEGLRDLGAQAYRCRVLEIDEIAKLVGDTIKSGNDDERMYAFDVARSGIFGGSPEEKKVVDSWLSDIIDVAMISQDAQVATRAFDVLVSAGNAAIARILTEWIRNPDDSWYKNRNPIGMLTNVGHYGLKESIREAMYDLLEEDGGEMYQDESVRDSGSYEEVVRLKGAYSPRSSGKREKLQKRDRSSSCCTIWLLRY